MRKFVAIALAALMLLALIPSASAAQVGTATNVYGARFDGSALVSLGSDMKVSGSAITVNKPLADFKAWNIPGTAINSQYGGAGTWNQYAMFTADLAVKAPVTGIVATATALGITTLSTTTFATEAAAKAEYVRLLNANNGLRSVIPSIRYFANSVSYYADATVTSPDDVAVSSSGTSWSLVSFNWQYAIRNYTFYFLPIAGGTTAPYTVTAYEENKPYETVSFLFYIDYKDVLAANATNVAVSDYGDNKEYVRAYISGSDLILETVWGATGLKPAMETATLLNNNTPNPNYGQSKGYYPVNLQFYFKDASGNALPAFSQITSIKYGNFEILEATQTKKKAEYLPFWIMNDVTPWNSGFGRTTYLDGEGSLKLQINIGQFGYADSLLTATATGQQSASFTADARFITPVEYAAIAAVQALGGGLTISNETMATAVVNTIVDQLYPATTNNAGNKFNNVYLMNGLKTGVGEKAAVVSSVKNVVPVLWYQDIANTYNWVGEKLAFTINVNGVIYSFSELLKVQSVNRIDSYSFNLSETAMTIKVGETKAISAITGNPTSNMQAMPITWTSNNTAVATVKTIATDSKNAVVTGVTVGSTYVRAFLTTENKEMICTVNVVADDPAPVVPVITTVDYVVTCRALNVRTGAGTGNSKTGMAYRNDVLKVIEVNNDWAKIEWQNGTAYACLGGGKYLQPK